MRVCVCVCVWWGGTSINVIVETFRLNEVFVSTLPPTPNHPPPPCLDRNWWLTGYHGRILSHLRHVCHTWPGPSGFLPLISNPPPEKIAFVLHFYFIFFFLFFLEFICVKAINKVAPPPPPEKEGVFHQIICPNWVQYMVRGEGKTFWLLSWSKFQECLWKKSFCEKKLILKKRKKCKKKINK